MIEDIKVPAWLTRAVDKFDGDNYGDGDMLSHDWVRWALDVPVPKSVDDSLAMQWMMLTRMDEFREHLLTVRKIALQNVRGKGYRIVPPREQAEYAATKAMDGVKKALVSCDRLMVHTRTDELNEIEHKRHTDAHIRLCGIKDMVRRQRKDVFLLFKRE